MNFFNTLNDFCLDFKDFSANYKFIRKSKEPQLGEIQLMRHKPTGKIIQVKEQSVDNEADLNELLSSLEEFLPYNSCANFLNFLGFSIRQILLTSKPLKASNSIKWSVYMIYEYIDHDLEKEILLKAKTGDLFSEIFIWQILNSLINCLEALQKTGRRYGDLRLCNVYYSKTENFIKLLYTNYAKTSFDLIRANKLQFFRCFLAPEQLELIGEKRPNEKNLDLIKCEIFSIAIMILSLACYQNKERLYNMNEPTLLYNAINNKMFWVKTNYSDSLSSLLERMMSVNENLRPSLLDIKSSIHKYTHKINEIVKQPSESTIPKHHTTFNSFDSNMIISNNINNIEKNFIFDSVSLQKILNDSKSTKRTDKTTFSNGSKEILMLESKENSMMQMQKSIEIKDSKDLDNNGLQIKEKDLYTGSIIINDSEKKIPFFEKIKKLELSTSSISNPSVSLGHRRNVSEIPKKQKTIQPINRLSEGLNAINILETSLQELDQIASLIKKLEKKILYEKHNPTILKPTMKKIHYPNGCLYIGETKNGIREGKGLYYFSQREVYGGDWKNDKFEGKGVYIYENGDVYEGTMKGGQKEGLYCIILLKFSYFLIKR